ncbi:ABC transporter substrate-binding protein [Bradyrhizobium genomosp. I (2014)]|uniref:ABC transporter substrate-binding protein n=1 Tax=Bradyrhizobium genomosp. I (2014) TaxID=2683269 RepID=UPI0004B8FC81|nr:ABC transporter substrate-binding protein [Bradyrhizobium sp. CCBAU 43298]
MLNRRAFTISLAASALTGPSFAQGRPFTFCSFGGAGGAAIKTAFMDPISKKMGQIANVSPTNYSKIKAMVEANAVEWDLVDTGGLFVFQGRNQNLLEKIDYSIIDVSKLPQVWVKEYGLYTFAGATVYAYNKDQMPKGREPQSWKDFWDIASFPGGRTLYSRFYYNYEAALLAAGVPLSEVYPATDEKVDLAFDKLREIKPHVKVWWTAGAQPVQLLSTGEVSMALAWSGRVLDVMKENAPVGMSYNEAIAWGEPFVVPRGTPHRDMAMQVLKYCISDEAQTAFMNLGVYGPVLPSAAAKATPEQAKTFVTHPDNMRRACVMNDEEVAKYVAKNEERWQKFLIS